MSSERQLQVGAGTVPVQSRGGCELSYLSPQPRSYCSQGWGSPLVTGLPTGQTDRWGGHHTEGAEHPSGKQEDGDRRGGGGILEPSSQMGTAVAWSQRAQLRKALSLQAARIYSSA